jgi:2-methylcitrate dehydratase PrpD
MTDVINFIHEAQWDDFSPDVKHNAIRALVDTLGVSAAGSQTDLSRIICNHAARHFGGDASSLWWDGRLVSPVGAALANGMTIDSLDAHDGQLLCKGHIGCGLIPGLLAMAEAENKLDALDLLTALVIGYEIGTRAGVSLHASVPDYHTSGAWIAVTVAAVGARILSLDSNKTREAMGIAEYHGPRSQMMRCIDFPTMVKDGSGWGSMAGVSAAYLASDGFTGAPAVTIEGDDVSEYWKDLGKHFYINEQYIKLYPVCRWAQPAVEAVLELIREHHIDPEKIESVTIDSFYEAKKLCSMASNTEQAQYSLPFSVAVAAVRGTIDVSDVTDAGLTNPIIQELARKVKITDNEKFNAVFPAQRLATALIITKDGKKFKSGVNRALGDPGDDVSDSVITNKFRAMAGTRLDLGVVNAFETELSRISEVKDIRNLLKILSKSRKL